MKRRGWVMRMIDWLLRPGKKTAQEQAVQKIVDRVERRFERANEELDALIEDAREQRAREESEGRWGP